MWTIVDKRTEATKNQQNYVTPTVFSVRFSVWKEACNHVGYLQEIYFMKKSNRKWTKSLAGSLFSRGEASYSNVMRGRWGPRVMYYTVFHIIGVTEEPTQQVVMLLNDSKLK